MLTYKATGPVKHLGYYFTFTFANFYPKNNFLHAVWILVLFQMTREMYA